MQVALINLDILRWQKAKRNIGEKLVRKTVSSFLFWSPLLIRNVVLKSNLSSDLWTLYDVLGLPRMPFPGEVFSPDDIMAASKWWVFNLCVHIYEIDEYEFQNKSKLWITSKWSNGISDLYLSTLLKKRRVRTMFVLTLFSILFYVS